LPFFALMALFMMFSLLTFACLSRKAQMIEQDMKELPENIYKMWEDFEEFRSFRGRTELNDLAMNDAAIWSHSHRMYVIGNNSIKFPWFIPKDFPRDALNKQDRDKFIEVIDLLNTELVYSTAEKVMYRILSVIFPPGADSYLFRKRKAKFDHLRDSL